MNFSKQSALGVVMLLLGGTMLYTTIKSEPPKQAQIENVVDEQDVTLTVAGAEDLTVEPLTTDIKTETDFLEKQQQEREALVKNQEEKAKNFVAEQEDNKQSSEAKVDKEGVSHPKVASRQNEDNSQKNSHAANVTSELSQGATTYTVAAGEGLIKVAKDHNIPLEVLAEANDMYFLGGLMYGQKIIIPSATQVAKLEKSAKASQKKRAVVIKAKRAKEAAIRREQEAKLAKARLKEKAEREKIALRAKKKADEQKAKRKEEAQKLAVKKEAEAKRQQEALAKRAAAKKTAAEQQAKRREAQKVAAKKAADKKKKAAEQQAKRNKAAADKKRQQELAQKKASEKQKANKEDKATRGTFGIQVTLAADQKSADAVAAKLRKVGYKTKTSQTDRGVRVMVGPVKGKSEALKLKDKINKDSRTGVHNAWVLFWR